MVRKQLIQSYDGNKIDLDIMIHIDTDCVRECYDSMSCVDFIKYVTDQYLEAVGGSLTAENMEMLSADQHSLLCYRYMLDEVMEGGFIQLVANGFAPYVLYGPFPYVVKKEWEMRDFSKLLYEAKSECRKHEERIMADMSIDDFMALYEELEDLNELGDEFLDEYQEKVSPAVAKMIVDNLQKYV